MSRLLEKEPWQYRVEFSVGAQALESDDQESISRINGRILYMLNEDEITDENEHLNIGTVNGYLIQISRMLNNNEDIFDECDAHSQALIDYISELLDFETCEFHEKIIKTIGDISMLDILILDLVEVHPEHRGLNLGLAGAIRFIEIFGRGCGMVACKPFPLQFDISRKDNQEWLTQMQMAKFEQEKKAAEKKLQKYWGRLGFKRIPKTPYYGLNMDNQLPSRSSLGLK